MEIGVVVAAQDNGRMRVRVQRSEACGHCAAKGACHTLGGTRTDVVLDTDNDVGAALGDQVVLAMPEGRVLLASTIVYLVPAASILAGIGVAALVSGTDGALLGGAVAGGAVGAAAVAWLGRVAVRRWNLRPRVVRVVAKNQEES